MTFLNILAVSGGMLLGLIFCIIVLALAFLVLLPIYASKGHFVNKPHGLQKSGIHFFTEIEPGQEKILERAGRPVRTINWKNPTQDVWLPIRRWAELVETWTGLVFTGIYPFQKVREYELERTTIRRREDGTQQERDLGKSNLVLDVKSDLSDHFRVRQFLFPVHISGAETKDKIPLDIIGVAEMEVKDSNKAAYGTDRWDHAMTNLITDKINDTTKSIDLDQALTAVRPEDARKVADSVKSITDDEITCGIQINAFRILEINPVLDEEDRKKIRAEALALQVAKATRIDASARADGIKAVNKANKVGGEAATATMEAEAFVRVAEAVGKSGGSAILMPPGGKNATDPVLTAILAELKELNKK